MRLWLLPFEDDGRQTGTRGAVVNDPAASWVDTVPNRGRQELADRDLGRVGGGELADGWLVQGTGRGVGGVDAG